MNRRSVFSLVAALAIAAGLAAGAAIVGTSAALTPDSSTDANPNGLSKQCAFQNDMRKLWEDHVTWTRVFIISAAADLPDKDAATGRLLQNQVDIGNAIKPFYGDPAGDKLTALLKEHITTAAELVAAAKAGQNAKMEDAKKRWYSNADAIAGFLSGANSKNWPGGEMKKMMREHLDLTTAEVIARLHGDWATDVKAYDEVHQQILKMADMLSAGIIDQFPKKFV